MKKLKIGFIGNFEAPYSTENDRKWSFEQLGHEVITFQENKTNIEDLIKTRENLDVLFYSHTHGWEIPQLKEIFEEYKQFGVPTASVHLDRWAWLDREKDIGKEATWFTEYHFMADYSPEAQEIYSKHELKKVFYLRPGVVGKMCYKAKPNKTKFPHEIVFVGSKGYHPEYSFRPKLIDFLTKTYGSKFGHYGDGIRSVRGDELNVLYSTAKIAVGDTCFGGRPNYVSDQYFETRGRNGFLLHPHIEGVDHVGVAQYKKENLESLKDQIDFYLDIDKQREKMREDGFNHVKKSETYTHRAKEMLNVIFK